MSKTKQKKPKAKMKIKTEKLANSVVDPMGFYSLKPTWSFHRMATQQDNHIKVDYLKADDNGDCCCPDSLLAKLGSFENRTWKEIMQDTHDDGESSHHPISDFSKLTDKERRLIERLQIEELFSLRLSNLHRIYGVLESGVLQILWYDPEHRIYVVSKKHT